jgi:glycosyltransferase involved in cell wall biosynthesis
MYRLMHVAAHFGAGVGAVVNSLPGDKFCLNKDNRNKEPLLSDINIIKDYDFVLCHVWNHPAMFEFLIEKEIPPCRLLGWSHMSGLHPPYVLFNKLINFFDTFYYTSPISNGCGIERDYIWSSCDIDPFLKIKKKPHKGFNIGYIGTIDYSKMYPGFINICEQINIPDVKFIVVGEGCDLDNLKGQVKIRGMQDKFSFTGWVKDIIPYLKQFDMFLYPLARQHFGTAEQILGQAMAAGLPCVTFDNPAESFILGENNIAGFVRRDEKEIIATINIIYKNLDTEIMQRLIRNIRRRAHNLYSLETTIQQWNNVFDKFYSMNKKLRTWKRDQ